MSFSSFIDIIDMIDIIDIVDMIDMIDHIYRFYRSFSWAFHGFPSAKLPWRSQVSRRTGARWPPPPGRPVAWMNGL